MQNSNDAQITMFQEVIQNNELIKPAYTAKGKDVVLIIGLTGAGKTTLAAYLSGSKMIETEIDDYTCIIPENKEMAEKLGHGCIAKTNIPEIFSCPQNQIMFSDTPGFKDNRGPKARIESSLSTELFIEKANSIKAVIVVISAEHFDTKGTALTNLAELLGKFIDLSIIEENIYFVITKQETLTGVKKDKRFKFLQKRIGEIHKNYNETLQKRMEDLASLYNSRQELDKAVSTLSGMITTLHCLKSAFEKGKVSLIDWFSDASRHAIMQWLMTLTQPIDKAYLHFSHYDNLREAFDSRVNFFLDEAIKTFREVATLSSKLEVSQERLRASEVKQSLEKLNSNKNNTDDKKDSKDINEVIRDTLSTCENNLSQTLKPKKENIEKEIKEKVKEAIEVIKKLEGPSEELDKTQDNSNLKEILSSLIVTFNHLQKKQAEFLKKVEEESNKSIISTKNYIDQTKSKEVEEVYLEVCKILQDRNYAINCKPFNDYDKFLSNILKGYSKSINYEPLQLSSHSLVEVATFFSFQSEKQSEKIWSAGYKILHDSTYNLSIVDRPISWGDYFKPRLYLSAFRNLSANNIIGSTANVIGGTLLALPVNVISKMLGNRVDYVLLLEELMHENLKKHVDKKDRVICKIANLPICKKIKYRDSSALHLARYYTSYWLMPDLKQKIEIILPELQKLSDELTAIDLDIAKNESIIKATKAYEDLLITHPENREDLSEKIDDIISKIAEIPDFDELMCSFNQQAKLLQEKRNVLNQNLAFYHAIYLNHEILGSINKVFIREFQKRYEEFFANQVTIADFVETSVEDTPSMMLEHAKQSAASAKSMSTIEKVILNSRELFSRGLYKEAENMVAEVSRNMAEKLEDQELEELKAYLLYYQALQKDPIEAYQFYEGALQAFAEIYKNYSDVRIAAIINEIMVLMGKRYNLNNISDLHITLKSFEMLKQKLFNFIKNRRYFDEPAFFETLKEYLANGYDINVLDEFNNTLLNYAIMYQRDSAVYQLVVTHNAHFDISNIIGETAVNIAINSSNFHSLNILLEKESIEIEQQLVEKNFIVMHKLIDSLFKKTTTDIEVIKKFILKINSSLRQKWLLTQYDGKSLWQYINKLELETHRVVLELFIPNGSAMEIKLLAAFIQGGQSSLCQFVLKRWDKASIDLNHLLPDKKTVLGLAINLGNIELIELLLSYGADINKLFASHMLELTSENRKGFTSMPYSSLAQAINLSDNFIIGTAVEHGGCFFDSLAQCLNAMNGVNQYTEKSLRESCYQYYKDNQQVVETWHTKDYHQGTIIPNYANIRHTSKESGHQPSIWGRPNVEGLILCRTLNLKAIQVIEAVPDPETQAITLGYYIITPNNYQQTQAIDISSRVPTIIASRYDLHFVPVLPKEIMTNVIFISPLRLAILKRDLAAVNCLLNLNNNVRPNLRERNQQLQTLFHTATILGEIDILKVLHRAVADEEKLEIFADRDEYGNTVLHLSLKQGNFACFQWLLQTCLTLGKDNKLREKVNAVVNMKNHTGEIPLKTAIFKQDIRAVQTLCESPVSFWNNNEGHYALLAARTDTTMPPAIIHHMDESKIKHCVTLVKVHMQTYLNNDLFHKPFIKNWIARLEKLFNEDHYAELREKVIATPIWPLQMMAEKLAINIISAIRDQYKSKEDAQLLKNNIEEDIYHAWDQLLKKAITKTLDDAKRQVLSSGQMKWGTYKKDKQRAFTRALKASLRDYFYVARALYEGEVLKNDETFNAFKAIFNIATPSLTEATAKLNITSAPVGVIFSVISASLELITRIRQQKVKVEAGRFIQAFGLCGPTATANGDKNIEMDPEKLKIVCEVLYQRYRDQIEKCTIAYEADRIRLTPTSGIYVLAKAMGDRIFQHIITEGSLMVEDNRSLFQKFFAVLANVHTGGDVYREHTKIALPARCILAVVFEHVGEDRNHEVETETWVRNNSKTKDQWYVGGILSKTGLKLERNHNELYIREGNIEQTSLQDKYGYCYVSEEMMSLNEIKIRNFTLASKTVTDQHADNMPEEERESLRECKIL